MKRRHFLKGAATTGIAAGVAAAAAGAAFPTPALSQGLKEFKLVMTWPLNAPGLGTSAQRVARRIAALSDNRIKIKVYGAGQIPTPARQMRPVGRGSAPVGRLNDPPARNPITWIDGNELTAVAEPRISPALCK